jgi:enoyl-CoA hydratase
LLIAACLDLVFGRAMSDQPVLCRRHDGVGVLTFNRPESLNALDLSMLLSIEQAMTEFERDEQVRAIVITGTDPTFMAGGDVNEMTGRSAIEHYSAFGAVVQRVFRRIEGCAKPTLAAVNGWALGGGMQLMLCADLRILAEDARIGLPEIKLGLFPGGGGSQRLLRQLPLCQAKLLMFTGDPISAREALALGLVNQVVPRDQLMGETLALASRIALHPPLALRHLKTSMLHGADMPLPAAIEYEHAMVSLLFDSDDTQEGCSAFVDKREPRFGGR